MSLLSMVIMSLLFMMIMSLFFLMMFFLKLLKDAFSRETLQKHQRINYMY